MSNSFYFLSKWTNKRNKRRGNDALEKKKTEQEGGTGSGRRKNRYGGERKEQVRGYESTK